MKDLKMNKQHIAVFAVFFSFLACVSLTFCGLAAISLLQPQTPIAPVAQAAPAQEVASAQQNPSVQQTGPEPTATPIPTTPTHTATPIPTNTPTPEPTSTPMPTPTSKPEIPVETQAYLQTVSEKMNTMGDAVIKLGELLQSYEQSNDWVINTAWQMTLIRTTHEELVVMSAPADMTQFHTALLNATNDCNTATHYLTVGIDNQEENQVYTGLELIRSCGESSKNQPDFLRNTCPLLLRLRYQK